MKIKPSRAINSIGGLINFAENYYLTPAGFTVIILTIAFVRDFFEGLLEPPRTMLMASFVRTTLMQMAVLFNLEWLALFICLAVVIKAATGETPVKIIKILLFFYGWIIVVPFFDIFAAFPGGCRIDYVYTVEGYVKALLFFFYPPADVSVCPGIRFEVFAGFILCGSYIFIKTRSILKSASGAFMLYFLSVSSMAFPVFILLPFLPFDPRSFNSLIHAFFFGPALAETFIARVSIMIFFFLAPFLFVLYYMHYGKKEFNRFLPLFFSPTALVYAAAVLSGFIASRHAAGGALFTGPFDPYLVFAACLLALFIALFCSIGKKIPGGKAIAVPLGVFTAIACAPVSIYLTAAFIIIICVRFVLKKWPNRLLKPLQNSAAIFLIYIAGSYISAPASGFPAKIAVASVAAAVIYFNGLFFETKKTMVYNVINFGVVAVLIAGAFIK